LWLPAVPEFALKLLLGEMTYILLKGGKASSDKIEHTGFKFTFPELEGAMRAALA
jgi:NAD dependent epimerase/dehydratase family enzyme